jgi:hypothetical protein
LLGLSVGAKLFLGLRHNQRRGLRMRRIAYKLHRRKSGGGEQHETKFCHDDLGPRKVLWQQGLFANKVWRSTNKR